MTDDPDAQRVPTDEQAETTPPEPDIEAPETESIRDDGEPLGANVA